MKEFYIVPKNSPYRSSVFTPEDLNDQEMQNLKDSAEKDNTEVIHVGEYKTVEAYNYELEKAKEDLAKVRAEKDELIKTIQIVSYWLGWNKCPTIEKIILAQERKRK